MIQGEDRVARVLERDERLLEVFIAVSPHFERLRNRGTRRLMARLVTVSQAARIAGVQPELLLDRLNQALESSRPAVSSQTTTKPAQMNQTLPMPGVLESLDENRIVDLDVRDELRNGQEPFQQIIAVKNSLEPGSALRLRAIFEPVPLYHVLGKQGFAHWTEKLAEDDWRVWFFREDDSSATISVDVPAEAATAPDDDDVEVLDVRGLEPPEPMVRTLAALERLPAGKTLVQINVRVPQFLLPKLDQLGYSYEVREQNEELVRLFIRRS